ncbi:hypothetical protein CEE84_11665, partial [Lactobacillus crispatus]
CEDTADIGKGSIHHEPCGLDAEPHRRHRIHPLGHHFARRGGAGDSQDADPLDVVEIVLDLTQFGCGLQGDGRPIALDCEGQLLAGIDRDDALHVGEAVDDLAVERGHHVAGLKARGCGRNTRLHGVH